MSDTETIQQTSAQKVVDKAWTAVRWIEANDIPPDVYVIIGQTTTARTSVSLFPTTTVDLDACIRLLPFDSRAVQMPHTDDTYKTRWHGREVGGLDIDVYERRESKAVAS